ncbi:Aldo ket red domain containing protein, partial [Asbolus verrucosus]
TVLKYSTQFIKMFLTLPNGSKLPAIGLGTSGVPNEADLERAIDIALEVGYRHIDTAYLYRNEKVIGRALKKWLDSGKLKREEVFITTKLPVQGVHPDRVEYFMKQSLSNLQLEYVDMYLIHFPVGCLHEEGNLLPPRDENGICKFEPKTDHGAVWRKMEEQVDAGRTKHIGLSSYNISQIETILKIARIKPENLQIEVHVNLQQRKLVDFCHKNGITVVAFSPLGSPMHNEKMKKFTKDFKERQLPDMLGDPTINKIAQKYSKSAAQVMLRFLLQLGVGAIPKSVTPQRIRDNFDVFDFVLSDEDMATLTNLEIGEEARIGDWAALTGAHDHPDYPFKNKY